MFRNLIVGVWVVKMKPGLIVRVSFVFSVMFSSFMIVVDLSMSSSL